MLIGWAIERAFLVWGLVIAFWSRPCVRWALGVRSARLRAGRSHRSRERRVQIVGDLLRLCPLGWAITPARLMVAFLYLIEILGF